MIVYYLFLIPFFFSSTLFSYYVTCSFRGQLGNQLFEIATTTAYALDYDLKPVFPQILDAWGGVEKIGITFFPKSQQRNFQNNTMSLTKKIIDTSNPSHINIIQIFYCMFGANLKNILNIILIQFGNYLNPQKKLNYS